MDENRVYRSQRRVWKVEGVCTPYDCLGRWQSLHENMKCTAHADVTTMCNY
jgi:hypothetical protein